MNINILSLVKRKGRLVLNTMYKRDTIIVDFYNLYCNLVNFEIYGTFTRKTFGICMSKLMGCFRSRNVIVVSKEIFEVPEEDINKLTAKHKNLIYITVSDDNRIRSQNKERDDFVCLMYNYISRDTSYIISNDKFANIAHILDNIKPFSMYIYREATKEQISITRLKLDEIILSLKKNNFTPTRTSFYFQK